MPTSFEGVYGGRLNIQTLWLFYGAIAWMSLAMYCPWYTTMTEISVEAFVGPTIEASLTDPRTALKPLHFGVCNWTRPSNTESCLVVW